MVNKNYALPKNSRRAKNIFLQKASSINDVMPLREKGVNNDCLKL